MARRPTHPLDDLTPEEVEQAVSLIKDHPTFMHAEVRFCNMMLQLPPKEAVRSFEATGEPELETLREAFAVLLVNTNCYEVVVSLNPERKRVVTVTHIPYAQPSFLANEYEMCEELVQSDPRVQAALEKRGITDISQVMVDVWVGFYDHPKARIGRPLLFLKTPDQANFYARPIDGIIVTVDLSEMRVLEVKDIFDTPIPPPDASHEWQNMTNFRKDLKPIHITQPEGVSYKVDGNKVNWQKWQFRVGFNAREGLVLYQIGYEDKGRVRPILYQASIPEMVVPYGDPVYPNYMKNAFDGGEDGLGRNAHSLKLGCDCLGTIHYFDAVMTDSLGRPYQLKNAICMHEEDWSMLWKHKDWRTDDNEMRRGRRLVLSFFTTIANYDYGFYWYFYLDGSISMEAKLTGILSTSTVPDGKDLKGYGTMLAKNLYGPIHQHLFCARLDFEIDGPNNCLQEINVQAVNAAQEKEKQKEKKKSKKRIPNRRFDSAFYATVTTFHNEKEAQRRAKPSSARLWKVVNPNSKNRVGNYCGYKIVAQSPVFPFANPDSMIAKRAGFMKNTIWATPFNPKEKYPGGDYPIQRITLDGLEKWTELNRNIYNTNIVIWHVFGITHVVRAEDWPVMPMEHVGFELKPVNFFDYSPAMDVPPSNDTCSVLAPLSKL